MENEDLHICPYINSVTCRYGECYLCKDCESNPEKFIDDPAVLKEFLDKPYSVFCMTCWEFVPSPDGHPGHVLATGMGEFNAKIPEMIMDRLKRRDRATDNQT